MKAKKSRFTKVKKLNYRLYNADADGLLEPDRLLNYAMMYGEEIQQFEGEIYDGFIIENPLLFMGEGFYTIRVYISGDCKYLYVGVIYLKREGDELDWFFEGKKRVEHLYKLSISNVSSYYYENQRFEESSKIITLKLKSYDLLFVETKGRHLPVPVSLGYVHRNDVILGNFEKNPNQILTHSEINVEYTNYDE